MVGYCYSLEEIEAVLPEIAFLVEEAAIVYQELKQEYAKAMRIVKTTEGGEKMLSQGLPERQKRQIRVLNSELNDIIEEIESLGGILRDVEKGVVDFPSRFQGEDIYYCWQIGDDRIEYWHPADTGSTERKKIYRIGK